MSRWPLAGLLTVSLTVSLVVLSGIAGAQQNPNQLPPDEDAPVKSVPKPSAPQTNAPQSQTNPAQSNDDLPPDEDASAAPKEKLAFNPVKSKRDVSVGDFYFKKGDFKAAVLRYSEATQYNDANAEAWLRLGEAQEKRDLPKDARTAYEKYLQLTPNAKNAAEIKKRVERLK
jgi:tetratricopeptide (TPR) repeat protein